MRFVSIESSKRLVLCSALVSFPIFAMPILWPSITSFIRLSACVLGSLFFPCPLWVVFESLQEIILIADKKIKAMKTIFMFKGFVEQKCKDRQPIFISSKDQVKAFLGFQLISSFNNEDCYYE